MKKKSLTVIAVFLALISLSACAKKTNGVEEENKKETAENSKQNSKRTKNLMKNILLKMEVKKVLLSNKNAL